ncbi:MAG: amidohydrolase family protein [Candidatus Thermoplasmatota archaeon]|nr:amidohydrolase family protein [Candidatus Thermoplasmatota archaeon]
MIFRGRTFDGKRLIENAEFEVNEKTGLIEYAEEIGKSARMTKGKKIDNKDVTFLPGLIDTHIHFFGTGNHSLNDWVLTDKVIITIRSVEDSKNLLNAGYTTVRTLGDKVSIAMSRAERMNILFGPRIVSAGFSIAETGGNDDPRGFDLDFAKKISVPDNCDSPWECRRAVRMNVRDGAESIKAYSSTSFAGGGMIKNQLTREELGAIADEAHKSLVTAASHAYGESAIENSVMAGFDSIEHGLGLNEAIADEMKKRGTFFVPTMATYVRSKNSGNATKDQIIKKHLEREVKLAMDMGLKIAAGTDFVGSSDDPHGMNYKEIAYISSVTGPEKALQSGTSLAAECIGLKNTGLVSKGNIADVIAVKGNPTTNIEALNPENVLLVIKNGRVVKDLLY